MDFYDPRRNATGPWGPTRTGPSQFTRRLLIILTAGLLLLFGVVSIAPPMQIEATQWPYVIKLVLFLAIIAVGVAASRRRLSSMAADAAIWLAIGLVLMGGYSYRFELRGIGDRILGELLPGEGRSIGENAVSFKRAEDQHFWIDASVNGTMVRFLVDTGASGIVLNQRDAVRLGFDPSRLDYTDEFSTANGRTYGAPVTLQQLWIGPLHFDDVPASVNQGELRESLLGMRLLERFSTIEISKDTLTIRQ